MEKMLDKKDDAEHHIDVGAEKEESAGECHSGLHTYKILYILFKVKHTHIYIYAPSDRGMWDREQFLGTVWKFARGSGVLDR